MDKRFNVKITFELQEVKNGKEAPFSEQTYAFFDLSQFSMLDVEARMFEVLKNLYEQGVAMAVSGLTAEQMEALKKSSPKIFDLLS